MKIKSMLCGLLAALSGAALFISAPAAQAQLVNTSVRVRVGTGDDVLITGFVLGPIPKTFLFRAVGPGLAAFGLTTGTLADPTMSLRSGQTVLQTNNDWSTGASAGAIAQAASAVAAFPLTTGSRDSALIATLQAGPYTVTISGADGGAGIALFEMYEIAAPPASTGTLRGVVRDGVTNAGVSGVSLAFVSSTGAALGTATTSTTGEYSITLPAGAVTANVSVTGYVSTTLSATIVSNSTIQADNVLFAQNVAGTGTLTGRITNALTGQGLSGATLRLRAGANTTTGTVFISTATTTSTGDYTLTAPSGTYTCEISLTGFVTTHFVCVSVGGRTIANQNASVSPVLSGSDLRIVLTWGETPRDLDSHFTGPTTSTSRFHVYYSAPSTTGVNLDVDDTTSYGPETITVTQFLPGVYRYSIHDFTNRSSTTSTAMSSQSNAQVKVFQGSTQIATFNVPSGQTGNLWTVFEMDGASKTITPKNTITNIANESVVPSRQDDWNGTPEVAETELYFRLPPKK